MSGPLNLAFVPLKYLIGALIAELASALFAGFRMASLSEIHFRATSFNFDKCVISYGTAKVKCNSAQILFEVGDVES